MGRRRRAAVQHHRDVVHRRHHEVVARPHVVTADQRDPAVDRDDLGVVPRIRLAALLARARARRADIDREPTAVDAARVAHHLLEEFVGVGLAGRILPGDQPHRDGAAAPGQPGQRVAQGGAEPNVRQVGQHRDVDRLLGAGDQIVDPVEHRLGVAQAARRVSLRGRAGLERPQAAAPPDAAIGIAAACRQCEIMVAARTIGRDRRHVGGAPAPDVGGLDQPVGVEPVVGRQVVGDAAPPPVGVELGELRHRLGEQAGGRVGVERRDRAELGVELVAEPPLARPHGHAEAALDAAIAVERLGRDHRAVAPGEQHAGDGGGDEDFVQGRPKCREPCR